jgi:hypothetical protein
MSATKSAVLCFETLYPCHESFHMVVYGAVILAQAADDLALMFHWGMLAECAWRVERRL